MNAINEVYRLAREAHENIAAELPGVRRDYPTLEMATRLMHRHRLHNIEEAFREEARQRILRRRWALVTA